MVAPTADDSVALFRHFPELRASVPWVNLGNWPTPVQQLPQLSARIGGAPIWVKREDQSSLVYGGNKVRTLEAIMGEARATGCDHIWATGAYGSNHAVATVLHAAQAGLHPGVALFPQPPSGPARANLRVMLAAKPELVNIPSMLALPLAMARLRRRGRGKTHYVMAPGAAGPVGAFGAMSAAIELAEQVAAAECPPPRYLVVAAGSTCTCAGLLVGLHAAAHLGIGFDQSTLPNVVAVRVTPWPVTSPTRITWLAYKTAQRLAQLSNGRVNISFGALRKSLRVAHEDLGGGYGKVTARGVRAAAAFKECGGPPLDIVYSAKSGATLLDVARATSGPVLFWATKSSAPLPSVANVELSGLPGQVRRWLVD